MWIIIWILLFIGAYLLIYFSADKFIDTLKDLSLKFNVSPFLIGLLILGIDPEESIASIVAAINNLPYIAAGNVIGNSIISLSFCFALPAVFYGIKLEKIPNFYLILMISGASIIIIGYFLPFNLLITGIVNLILFVAYLGKNLNTFRKSKKTDIVFEDDEDDDEEEEAEESGNESKNLIIKTGLFFILILTGGHFLILATQNIISLTGIEESFFGLVIIAFFTNVEEILLLVKSIQKGQTAIGVGGMIGKVIWNLGFTYGISGIIVQNMIFDFPMLFNSVILLFSLLYFSFLVKRRSINKYHGYGLFFVFLLYLGGNILLQFV